jgi:hypothetical protein
MFFLVDGNTFEGEKSHLPVALLCFWMNSDLQLKSLLPWGQARGFIEPLFGDELLSGPGDKVEHFLQSGGGGAFSNQGDRTANLRYSRCVDGGINLARGPQGYCAGG